MEWGIIFNMWQRNCYNIFILLSYLQDHFILIVSEFMYIPWKYAQEQAAKQASAVDGELCTPSIPAAIAETFELQMTQELKKKVLIMLVF